MNLFEPIALAGGYFNPLLVILSYFVACLASFTAVSLTQRVAQLRGASSGRWLVGGAFSMGIGIWSMHFVGMLAFSMDMPFTYDIPITIFSLFVGMVSAGFAIFVASRSVVGWRNLFGGGLLLGFGIAGMHYSGMGAMVMAADILYDTWLFSLSIGIAITASVVAIWIISRITRREGKVLVLKIGAAMVMGAAICGMHYTGMMAAIYIPRPGMYIQRGLEFDSLGLAISVAGATIVILLITLLAIYFERKLNVEKKVAEKLSHLVEARTRDLERQKQSLAESKLRLEQEIEERKAAEEESTQLSRILDDSSNEIYFIDAQTLKIISANKGAQRNVQYARDELKGMGLFDLKKDLSEEQFRALVAPLHIGKEEYIELQTNLIRKDGSSYLVKANLQLSTVTKSPVYVAMLEDITERKQLESQLAQAQKLESIGQLAAGVAHEINTPIQYVGDNTYFVREAFSKIKQLIKIYEELLEHAKSGDLSEDYLETLEGKLNARDFAYYAEEVPGAIAQSIEGIERVAKIVRALKEFSHPGQEEKKWANLNRAIETTVTVAGNEWRYIADLQLELDPALPDIKCMPGELNQVILNLIVNASHAIRDKLGPDSEEKGQIRIATMLEKEWVRIEVEDTGGGIPDHIKNRVFDPFFTTKEVGEGTGQGLAIAYSVIVDKHQGQIYFDSIPGEGTTFKIRLPHEADVEEVYVPLP